VIVTVLVRVLTAREKEIAIDIVTEKDIMKEIDTLQAAIRGIERNILIKIDEITVEVVV